MAVSKVSCREAVYFSFITGPTVGYGGIVPGTAIGKIVPVLLGLVGILFMGLVLAAAVHSVATPRRRRRVKAGRIRTNVTIMAFASGNLFIVLLILIENCKDWFEHYELQLKDTDSFVDIIIPS